jgi:hypothetical protein
MTKINRNDPCPCGSGKKYKKCCEIREKERSRKKFEGLRGLKMNPFKVSSPAQSLAKHVFKLVSEPISKKKKEEPSPLEDTPIPGEKPKSYGTLEELIGL